MVVHLCACCSSLCNTPVGRRLVETEPRLLVCSLNNSQDIFDVEILRFDFRYPLNLEVQTNLCPNVPLSYVSTKLRYFDLSILVFYSLKSGLSMGESKAILRNILPKEIAPDLLKIGGWCFPLRRETFVKIFAPFTAGATDR